MRGRGALGRGGVAAEAGFDLLPYASIAEPPPELRDRILTTAAARQARTGDAAARRAASCGAGSRPRRRPPWLWRSASTPGARDRSWRCSARSPRRCRSRTWCAPSRWPEPASAGGAVGRVALDLDAKKGAVVLKGMPVLPAGQVYRLWAKVADKSVPCGEFKADARRRRARAVRGSGRVVHCAPIGRLFVTVEPSRSRRTPRRARRSWKASNATRDSVSGR